MTTTQTIAEAIHDAFGVNPWLTGDVLKKAKTKQAFARALSIPPTQIKSADLKNLTNQMWEEGLIEIIPPRDRERSFKFKLIEQEEEQEQHQQFVESPQPETPVVVEQVTEPAHEVVVQQVVVERTPLPEPRPQNRDEEIFSAYEMLRRETLFRHVYISDIHYKSEIPVAVIHEWASRKARAREFELGQADWSLANESQRKASIKINGTHYLTVGRLN